MAQDSPSRKQDQYIVRFPDGMRDRLKAAAAENGRSMNAEIVQRLESTFPQTIEVPLLQSTSRVPAPTVTQGAPIPREELEETLNRIIDESIRRVLSDKGKKRE